MPVLQHDQTAYVQDHVPKQSPQPDPHSKTEIWQSSVQSAQLPAYVSVWFGNDLRPETKKPASYVSSDGMIWNAKSDPGLSEILYANRIFLPALLVLLSDPQSRHMYDRFDVLFFLILLELSIFFPFVHVKTHLYNIFHTFLIFPLFFYKKIRNSLSQTVPYLYL